jgi:hypothetical protein
VYVRDQKGYVYVNVSAYAYTFVYVHVCTCICTCVYMYMYMCVHVYGYVYLNKYVYVYVSLTISSVYVSNEHVDFSSIPCLGNIQHLKTTQKEIKIMMNGEKKNAMKVTMSGL